MQSTRLQRSTHQQIWNVYEDFSNEIKRIDEAQFQKALKRFIEVVTPKLTEESILDGGKIFGTPIVMKLMINLLTEIDCQLFPDKRSIENKTGKKGWPLTWEVDFGFDDSPRIREIKPDGRNEQDSDFDMKGRNNIIIHLANNLKDVERLNSGFIRGGSVQIIGRLMNRDCDFEREIQVLTHYFEMVENFEDRGDECYGFITDLSNWTFYKYCYKTNELRSSDFLQVQMNDILEDQEISSESAKVIKVLPCMIMRVLQNRE